MHDNDAVQVRDGFRALHDPDEVDEDVHKDSKRTPARRNYIKETLVNTHKYTNTNINTN